MEPSRAPLYQWDDIHIMAGETHTADFAMLNPNAKIPVPRPAGRPNTFTESNPLDPNYLRADGTEYLPDGRLRGADVLQWPFLRAIQPRAPYRRGAGL